MFGAEGRKEGHSENVNWSFFFTSSSFQSFLFIYEALKCEKAEYVVTYEHI